MACRVRENDGGRRDPPQALAAAAIGDETGSVKCSATRPEAVASSAARRAPASYKNLSMKLTRRTPRSADGRRIAGQRRSGAALGDRREPRARPGPVDLLMLCGIFGNVSEQGIKATVSGTPALLRDGGAVIWTRGATDPDLRPAIRQMV